MVIIIILLYSIRLLLINEKCAHVNVTPEDNKMIVFNNGTPNGSNVLIIKGGHSILSSTLGERLKWKKAQKKETKNIISETINNNLPPLRLPCTFIVWCPCQVDSRTTSRHHWYRMINWILNENTNVNVNFNHIQDTKLITIEKELIPVRMGHGLLFTKWNGVFIVSIELVLNLAPVFFLEVPWGTYMRRVYTKMNIFNILLRNKVYLSSAYNI